MSRTTLSKIENAKSPYSQRLLEDAAEAYGCEPEDLIMRDPTKPDAIWSILDTLKKADPAERELMSRLSATVLKKTGT